MNLKNYTPKNQLINVPKEVIAKMLERQVQQGNKENPKVFEDCISADKKQGGFTWSETKEGEGFWRSVLMIEDFDVFFKSYPSRFL